MPSPLALNRRTIVLLTLGLMVLTGLSLYRLLFAPPPGPSTAFSGRTMGTTWEVKVASPDLRPDTMRSTSASIQDTLDRVVQSMSTWQDDSELSDFNRWSSTEAVEISPGLSQVLQTAETISQQSGGAFDVTVGPLVEAWGFGEARPPESPPRASEIEEIETYTGHSLLVLKTSPKNTLRKKEGRVQIDVSAIAKGYGVDQVALKLEELGYFNYLVEVGGEIRARGQRTDGQVWRVAIEEPGEGFRRIHRVLPLNDRAMATSGDYRNFYQGEDGQRISHTLDPRSGRPIEHGLASVSVIHPSATQADAWATALNVLGPHAGYEKAAQLDLAAYFIVRGPDSEPFQVRATPAFTRYLSDVDTLSSQ